MHGSEFRSLELFAGAGLGILGTHHLLGWRSVGYVEMAGYPCKVLEARIKDGLLSPAPIFQMHTSEFIRLGYAAKYRGVANVVTAGFPCQPFSNAGQQQAGNDERNGWPDTLRIIREVRPEWVFLENVTGLLAGSHGYFGTVLGELAQSGYDAVWRVLSAAEVGAPHKRDRVWIVAHAQEQHRAVKGRETYEPGWMGEIMAHADDQWQLQPEGTIQEFRGWPGYSGQELADSSIERKTTAQQRGQWDEPVSSGTPLANANGNGRNRQSQWKIVTDETGEQAQLESDLCCEVGNAERQSLALGQGQRNNAQQKQPPAVGAGGQGREWWATEPGLGRVAHGVPNRVDRLKAIGNGQVPAVVAEVWRLLTSDFITLE
jgi:DNA (cytosine-5)-methyltransferase 1